MTSELASNCHNLIFLGTHLTHPISYVPFFIILEHVLGVGKTLRKYTLVMYSQAGIHPRREAQQLQFYTNMRWVSFKHLSKCHLFLNITVHFMAIVFCVKNKSLQVSIVFL